MLPGMAGQRDTVTAPGRPDATDGVVAAAAPPGRGPLRVLLVLDQPVLAEMVKLALAHAPGDFTARVAPDAAAAIGVLGRWRPHLAVVDMDLAQGEMLARLGYTAPPSAERVRVLALTCRGDLKARLAAFEQGVDDLLSVPFSPEELVARVLAVLRRSFRDAATLRPVLRLGELEIDILHHRRAARASSESVTPTAGRADEAPSASRRRRPRNVETWRSYEAARSRVWRPHQRTVEGRPKRWWRWTQRRGARRWGRAVTAGRETSRPGGGRVRGRRTV